MVPRPTAGARARPQASRSCSSRRRGQPLSIQAVRRSTDVADLADGIVEGTDWPLVPDGQYLATYQGHECVELKQFKLTPKVFIHLKLYDAGEHSGKVLYRAYRVKRRIDGKRFIVGRRSELLRMVCTVLYRTRPDRISLRELKRHLLRIRTRTVTKDAKQRELPAALQYSVVDDILCREIG